MPRRTISCWVIGVLLLQHVALCARDIVEHLEDILRPYEEFYRNCELKAELEVVYSDSLRKHHEEQARKTEKVYVGLCPGTQMHWKSQGELLRVDVLERFHGREGMESYVCFVANGVTLRYSPDNNRAMIAKGTNIILPTPLECTGLALKTSDGHRSWWRTLKADIISADPRMVNDTIPAKRVLIQCRTAFTSTLKITLNGECGYAPSRIDICGSRDKVLRSYEYEWNCNETKIPLITRSITTSFRNGDANQWYKEILSFRDVVRCKEVTMMTLRDLPAGSTLYDAITGECMVIGERSRDEAR